MCILILKYCWIVLQYVRPSFIPTFTLIKRKLPGGSEARNGPGWGWKGRRLQLGSLKGCGGRVKHAEADFFLGLPYGVFSWLWAMVSEGDGLALLEGMGLCLGLSGICTVTLSHSYAVLKWWGLGCVANVSCLAVVQEKKKCEYISFHTFTHGKGVGVPLWRSSLRI